MIRRLRRGERPAAPDSKLGALKLRAIDFTFERLGARTLADLGAVWAVDAGYSLYALDVHGAERAAICDDDFTDHVIERARDDSRVELIEGNFGEPSVAERVGAVDAVLMFDVLLHQVRPDWDQVLELYAPLARSIVLAGPWWNGEETVRLVDLDRDRYLEVVPFPDFHRTVIDRLDEINERRGRSWRDSHDIWQWGITDRDLRLRMATLGFDPVHHEHLGPWRGSSHFDDASYVFTARA